MQPQRAVFRLVVDELPGPGEKSLVFKPFDRLARTETHIAGKNVHSTVLRVSCSLGLVLADRQGTGQAHIPRHSGARQSLEPGIHTHDSGYGFAARATRRSDT